MPGLDPGIFLPATKKDRRDKPGDDGQRNVTGLNAGQRLFKVKLT